MAVAVIPNEGEKAIMKAWMDNAGPKVRLFIDDITPDPDTVAGDLTQPSYDPYAQQDYDPGDPVTDGAGKAAFAPVSKTFPGPTSGGPVDVYGWCVMQTVGGEKLIIAQRFADAPRTLVDGDDQLNVIITFKGWDKNQP